MTVKDNTWEHVTLENPQFSDGHVALFRQMQIDLGHAKPTYRNAEALLKRIGWKHNNAVRASVDFVAWIEAQ